MTSSFTIEDSHPLLSQVIGVEIVTNGIGPEYEREITPVMIEDLPVFIDLVAQERAAFFHVDKIDVFF